MATKMFIPGITITVPDNEVGFYKNAGYKVVEEPPAETPEVPEKAEVAPVEAKPEKVSKNKAVRNGS